MFDGPKDLIEVIPPIKRYVVDESLSWEEKYKKLEEHHVKETKWFEKEVLRLRKIIHDADLLSPEEFKWVVDLIDSKKAKDE